MFRIYARWFGTTIYVQIWENRIRVVDLKAQRSFDERPLLKVEMRGAKVARVVAFGNAVTDNTEAGDIINPFSHPRSLIGDHYAAEHLLKLIVSRLCGHRLLCPIAAAIIQPMEKVEDLTTLEILGLKQIGVAMGAQIGVINDKKLTLDPSIRSLDDFVNWVSANPR